VQNSGQYHIDKEILERLIKLGGVELLNQMIDLFSETVPELLEKAKEAFEADDLKTVERSMHSLKSTAANLGAMQLHSISEEMEYLAVDQGKEKISTLLPMAFEKYNIANTILKTQRM